VIRVEVRVVEAGVAAAGAGAGVVGREGLDAGDGRADVGLGGGLVRAILERQVGRDRDREQDAQDDDDDQKLDQRETTLVPSQARPQRLNHVVLLPRGSWWL